MIAPYYERDGITIYHGDAREVLPVLDMADHVITDPPYDARTHRGVRTGSGNTIGEIEIAFAPLDNVPETARLLLSAARAWVVAFCSIEMVGGYAAGAGERWVRGGFWHKLNGAPQFTGDRPAVPGEAVAIMHAGHVRKAWNGGGSRAYWETCREPDPQHPTQKPLELMRALVAQFTAPGDLVLDPFMGSGSTLRACMDLGRRAIGIELSEQYCEVAVRRLAQGVLV